MEPIEHAEGDQQSSTAETAEARGWLTRGVASVGVASFFSDSGHEITTSILPSFLTVTLRSSAGVLGVIEGVSDALTGLAKLFTGPLANDPERRLQMASGGYLVTAAATGAIGLAVTVWQAGLLRATAWLARGVRSPARDAMLASLAPRTAYGRAFGLERAGDNMGAVLGPLLAAGLVAWLGIRPALYLAAIPGMFAALAIITAAAEARKRVDPVQAAVSARAWRLARRRAAAADAPDRSVRAGQYGDDVADPPRHDAAARPRALARRRDVACCAHLCRPQPLRRADRVCRRLLDRSSGPSDRIRGGRVRVRGVLRAVRNRLRRVGPTHYRVRAGGDGYRSR